MTHPPPTEDEPLKGVYYSQHPAVPNRSTLIVAWAGIGILFFATVVIGTVVVHGGLQYIRHCSGPLFSEGVPCPASQIVGYVYAPLTALILVEIAGLCLILFAKRPLPGIGLSLFLVVLAAIAYLLLRL